ncbi:MAG: cation-translocating P-type ATPase [Bacteroidetes bacterium]|nr:cation-translocating P-type ATPase [Bacteroidota bacterium]
MDNFTGLTDIEVAENRLKYGDNDDAINQKNQFLKGLLDIIGEPLFIILVFTSIIYFILNQTNEGIIMLVALIFVASISLYQENKSNNALKELNKISEPLSRVLRNGIETEINSQQIVVNDLIIVEQGNIIPADGIIVKSSDFSVNESILTGESLPVAKNAVLKITNEPTEINKIYKGTLVYEGMCIALVKATGKNAEIGKIGKKLEETVTSKSSLQIQIKNFVKKMVVIGVIAFVIVWSINFYFTKNVLTSLLSGLTLAMSILPEEIPVAFSTFMALGTYYLYKKKIIVRNPHTVETLGAATVICTDKTGTITQNEMHLSVIYDFNSNKLFDFTKEEYKSNQVLEYAMWASETNPYDQMEKSIHEVFSITNTRDKRTEYKMIYEYPLSGNPPFMTHIFEQINNQQNIIIACKGAVESVLKQCKLTNENLLKIYNNYNLLTSKGYRVLAVAKSEYKGVNFPTTQFEFDFDFLGLTAFYDPPKPNIKKVINEFYKAGIEVKIITGDNADTTSAIASQIDFEHGNEILTGTQVLAMTIEELRKKVVTVNIFARMFPDAKLKVIEALKQNNEIVAMTGDGVNDALALKAAHIGIAMGQRGSEVAKKASSLILMNDDLENMVDAIALGRRIYENLKKAIRYIISIHIPIILIVTIPLLLFWKYKFIFFPIHVIFLELIMGPTCSIIYEREPIEKDSMTKKPRKMQNDYFSWHELSLSIIQGLAITMACMLLGYFFMKNNYSEEYVRTIVFCTLIFCNIMLTLVNRSFNYSIFETIKYKNSLIPLIITISLLLLASSIFIQPVRVIFSFEIIKFTDILICFVAAFAGVNWIEIYKSHLRNIKKKKQFD